MLCSFLKQGSKTLEWYLLFVNVGLIKLTSSWCRSLVTQWWTTETCKSRIVHSFKAHSLDNSSCCYNIISTSKRSSHLSRGSPPQTSTHKSTPFSQPVKPVRRFDHEQCMRVRPVPSTQLCTKTKPQARYDKSNRKGVNDRKIIYIIVASDIPRAKRQFWCRERDAILFLLSHNA